MRHKRAAGPLQRVVNDDLVWNMAVMVSLTPCRLGVEKKMLATRNGDCIVALDHLVVVWWRVSVGLSFEVSNDECGCL